MVNEMSANATGICDGITNCLQAHRQRPQRYLQGALQDPEDLLQCALKRWRTSSSEYPVVDCMHEGMDVMMST